MYTAVHTCVVPTIVGLFNGDTEDVLNEVVEVIVAIRQLVVLELLVRKVRELAVYATSFGDNFGESLEGSQAPPSFWEVPRGSPEDPRTSPEVFRRLSRRFSHCGT